MHRLLERQLKRCLGITDVTGPIPPEWQSLIEAVDAAYRQADEDRALLEHSLELSSQELLDRNRRLQEDIAQRKRVEEALRTAEETRRQLLANLVHELGRPIGALCSAMQALLGGADKDDKLRRELLLGMEVEAQGMQRLLEDLVGLHHQDSGTLQLQLRPVDLGEWVPVVLGPWREAAHRKGLAWEVEIPEPGAIPTIQADPDRLAQAIGNLLSNAIKYTPAGGTVSVEAGSEAGTEGGEVWIRVSDTGRGIEKDEQARIFEPFYRGGTHRLYPEGMGLGLAITRDLVAAHGGRLDVESAPDSGSRFTIRLPVTSPQPALSPL
jgi:signal transduction histidine kinase